MITVKCKACFCRPKEVKRRDAVFRIPDGSSSFYSKFAPGEANRSCVFNFAINNAVIATHEVITGSIGISNRLMIREGDETTKHLLI